MIDRENGPRRVLGLTGAGGTIPVFLASLVGFFFGQRVELMGNKSHRTEPPKPGQMML